MTETQAQRASLLLVEDDPVLRQEFGEYLRNDGFDVHSVASVADAERALIEPFDLMVLDLNLPDGSGVELCQRLRPYLRSGIVICSGRSERELRLSLLRSGADAFLVKPVDAEELSATLWSVLRRVLTPVASPMRPPQLPSLWRLDRVQHCLWAPKGKQIVLNAQELLLLQTLLEQPDRMVDRQTILARYQAAAIPTTGSRLETMVSRLRAKVFEACGVQLPLRASYGRGYIFAAHADLS
jgi:DNA-binding response OmpR family regulator